MTRPKGIYKFPVNFELESAAPLDAKAICPSVSLLTATSTWQTIGDTGNANVYKGMAVSVYNDPQPLNNTIWVLTTSGTGFQNLTSWKRVGTPDFCQDLVYLNEVSACNDSISVQGDLNLNSNDISNVSNISVYEVNVGNNLTIQNYLSASEIYTNKLFALTSTTLYQNISVTELSGFTVLGTLTSLNLPTSVQEGNNLVWLNGVGISATNFAVFDGDSAIRKLYITPRNQNPNLSDFYPPYRSQFLDGYLISSADSCDYGHINLNLGAENSRNLERSNLYNKPVSGVNLYFGVASDVKTVKFNTRNWNGFGNPNYPWRPSGDTVPAALSSSNVTTGRNYGLGYTMMLLDGETGHVGIGIPGVFDPNTNPNVDGLCFGGGPGEGKPNHRLTVYGNISSTGTVFASNINGGSYNNANWDSVYTNVNTNSANWQNTFTTVRSNSANWNSVYTNVNTNSANWNSVYNTVQNSSAFWDGNFCNETVYMANLSGCWNNSLSTSIINISSNLNLNNYSISGVNNILSNSVISQYINVFGKYINTLFPNKTGHYQWTPQGSNEWNSNFIPKILARSDSDLNGYDLATPAITLYNAVTGENKTVQLAFAGQVKDSNGDSYPVSIGGIIGKTGQTDLSEGFLEGSLNFYTVDKTGDRKDALIIDNTGKSTFNYLISTTCGNSDQWCQAYTSTSLNSANWNQAYTSVINNSALWGSSFTVSNTVGTSSINITIPQNYTNAFFNIGVVSGTNVRSSQMMVAWNGTNVVFTENATIDLGDTSSVILSAGYIGGNIVLQSIITSGTWTIKGGKQLI